MQEMTANQVRLIRDTWHSIGPIAKMVPQIFYGRLFEIDPSTKALFARTDMPDQHMKLLEALDLLADHADDLESLIPAFESLGRRHVRYGVLDKHYDSVESALLWTLERSFGFAFTHDAREAWTLAYEFIADTMRRTAATQEAVSA